jgi:hypothetical protein
MSFVALQQRSSKFNPQSAKHFALDELYIPESSLVATRSNTPEPKGISRTTSDSGSDRENAIESLTPHKLLSSESVSSNGYEEATFVIDVCPKKKKFNTVEERKVFVEEYKRKYKTEMCKNWELRGNCKFGDRCCFAHGKHELKGKTITHVKYKTKPCKQYHQTGYCPYGQRCQYLHKEAIMPNIFFTPNGTPSGDQSYTYEQLHEVNRLCGTECELEVILNKMPRRPRLSIFKGLEEQF